MALIPAVSAAFGLAVLGGIALDLARQSRLRTNPRNGGYGIRTAATKKSDRAWDAAHGRAAPLLWVFGLVDLALAATVVLLGVALRSGPDTVVVVSIGIAYAVALGGFAWAAYVGDAEAKRVERSVESTTENTD